MAQFRQSTFGEMTSEDVVFSFERARNEGTRRSLFSNVASVAADGRYGFVLNLHNPDPLVLGNLIFTNNASIVSKKAALEMGEAFHTDAVGTGPYQLVRFDAEAGVFLEAFPDYWGDKAKTKNIEMLYIADTTARTLALLAHQVDMIEGVRAPGWVQSMLGRDKTLQFDMTVPGSFNTLHFNLTRPPFDNLKVRQAVAHAIDQNVIAQALAPMGKPMFGLEPPTFPAGFAQDRFPEELRYAHAPARSKALLAEAGHPNGLTFSNFCSQREDYSSIMLIAQEQLRAAGINMDMKIVDHTSFHADNRKDLNSLVMNSSSYPPIPTQLYADFLASAAEVKPDGKGGANYSHYGVAMPGIDDLLVKAANATSFEDYLAVAEQIELQVRRDLPVIGLGTLSYTIARNPRVDIGYPVESGYARWRLHRATIVA
jgi:peptide/nickel transport system substrate-binding protein